VSSIFQGNVEFEFEPAFFSQGKLNSTLPLAADVHRLVYPGTVHRMPGGLPLGPGRENSLQGNDESHYQIRRKVVMWQA